MSSQVVDFVAAAGRVRAGDRDGAVALLAPQQLEGSQRVVRVRSLLVAGAVVTGVMEDDAGVRPAVGGVGLVAARLARAGASLDSMVIESVIAAHCTPANELGVLVELVERCAALRPRGVAR